MAISGLKFPLTVNEAGRHETVEEDEKIQQNIEAIANTSINERLMEPNMGTVGYRLLFRNINSTTATTIASLIQDAIVEQEPRVLARVTPGQEDFLSSEGSSLPININYRRKDLKQANSFIMEVGE